jgi:hypothetical protein
MITSDDNIKWFHQHVFSTYNMLETAVPMVDVAMYTIEHIERLFISHVFEKVKSDFFRIVIEYSKSNGNLVAFYIEPITTRLLDLIEDDEFNMDNFMMYHLSLPISIPGQSSPLSNLIEQDTPLASNLSEPSKMLGQGNCKESMWETLRILSLNRLLMTMKVYIQNWVLL